MNANIQALYQISLKSSRLIIGLMSGTSVDGLDVALCRCSGAGAGTGIEVLHFLTVGYNEDFRKEIKSIFSKKNIELEKLCLLNGWIAEQHAAIVNDCLRSWNMEASMIDLVASHGQTIFHAPKYLHRNDKFSNGTLQIGDGDHLAVKTGIITISDFRQKHIAAGGEGAPLAAYGDYLIFNKEGENRIMLNIGGIANFTFLPAGLAASEVFSTDTGPGNTLMDAYAQYYFKDRYFDEHAIVASGGVINELLLGRLKSDTFFGKGFPKTTGPELFNVDYVERTKSSAGIDNISIADMLATLNRFSAETIADAIKSCSAGLENLVVYTSGGGIHNPLLMKNIRELLPGYRFETAERLGINPDAKEAVLFAVLANECVAGGKINIGSSIGDIPSVSMGKISFPD